jgi:hypothetical protein
MNTDHLRSLSDRESEVWRPEAARSFMRQSRSGLNDSPLGVLGFIPGVTTDPRLMTLLVTASVHSCSAFSSVDTAQRSAPSVWLVCGWRELERGSPSSPARGRVYLVLFVFGMIAGLGGQLCPG